jgi:hypothetical protein
MFHSHRYRYPNMHQIYRPPPSTNEILMAMQQQQQVHQQQIQLQLTHILQKQQQVQQQVLQQHHILSNMVVPQPATQMSMLHGSVGNIMDMLHAFDDIDMQLPMSLECSQEQQQPQQQLVPLGLGASQQQQQQQGQQHQGQQHHGIAAFLRGDGVDGPQQPLQPPEVVPPVEVHGALPWCAILRKPSDIYTEWAVGYNGAEPLKLKESRGPEWRKGLKQPWAVRYSLIKSIEATAFEHGISCAAAAHLYDALFIRKVKPESLTSIHRKYKGAGYPFESQDLRLVGEVGMLDNRSAQLFFAHIKHCSHPQHPPTHN